MARVGCVAEGLHIGVSAREHGSDRPLADGTSASHDLYSQDLAKQHRSRGLNPHLGSSGPQMWEERCRGRVSMAAVTSTESGMA